MTKHTLEAVPGGELVLEGLADLAQDRLTEPALLLLVAGPRLRVLGVPVPEKRPVTPWEHQLYERLEDRLGGSGAHSFYNSLIRRIVSFARALEREQRRSRSG
jgi:hypothetical protein